MTKQEVRAVARQLGLDTADKPESQEICFVPDGNYSRLVEDYARHEMGRDDSAESSRFDQEARRTINQKPRAPGSGEVEID
jgi:tRNA U34 2-thiouridine synthase MnmA/TrmU